MEIVDGYLSKPWHNPCTDQDSEEIEEKMVRLFQEHIKLSAEINELEYQLDMKRSMLYRYPPVGSRALRSPCLWM